MDIQEVNGKIVKDGEVAVLYSPGYGAGWYSWNTDHSSCLFDPDIVQAVLAEKLDDIPAMAEDKWGDQFYSGGYGDLKVKWVTKGCCFEVDEYDGYERLTILGTPTYQVA